MNKRVAITTLLGCAALAAGCSKKAPGGQVAATVNGKEVTLQELNTELQAANLPPTADKQTVQRAILQRVIERKLLVTQAEDKGLDKTPEYLGQKRRGEELLLVQTFAKQQLASVPVPGQAEVDKFMTDNKNAFAERQQWVLDQIRFPTPSDTKVLAPLQAAHSIDQVAAVLTKLGIQFQRGAAGLDTAQLPPPVMAQLAKAPPTEPFVIPQPGVMTVSVVKERRPIPLDAAQARPAAVAAWRQQRFQQSINSQVQQLKSAAKIEYQNGFGPPPAAGAAAGAAATGAMAAGAAKP